MKWLIATVLVCGLLCAWCWADGDTGTKPATPATGGDEAKTPATEAYDRVVSAYMHEKWGDLQGELDKVGHVSGPLTKQQRDDVAYIRKEMPEMRPAWWKLARNSTAVSFQAKIWGKVIDANYMPTEELGMQAPVDIYRGKLRVIVTWKPSMVDSPRPADGELSKIHNFTKGDIAEAIVWHELGHNFLTTAMSAKDVIKLYNDFSMLYDHLQEFYADMTALYHAGPQARLIAMMMRLEGLDYYRDSEAHSRSSHAIGAVILTNMLMEPNKWPSVHFPGNVEDDETERKTIIYVYEHIDPNWTLAEDRQLQKMIGDYITSKGDGIFRSKGRVPLPNKLDFILMSTDDRDMQPKRDAWIKGKLEELVKIGRTDKPVDAPKTSKDPRDRFFHHGEGLRIEIPW